MEQLYIYLLYQSVNGGYDTYDSIMVAAPSAEDAATIDPYGDVLTENNRTCSTWAYSPSQVEVKLIGTAAAGIERGVIMSSFNAG